MKLHWEEKHTEIVPHYFCSMCEFGYKRKSALNRHFMMTHAGDSSKAVGKVEFRPNKQFKDPSPLTLDYVLANSKYL